MAAVVCSVGLKPQFHLLDPSRRFPCCWSCLHREDSARRRRANAHNRCRTVHLAPCILPCRVRGTTPLSSTPPQSAIHAFRPSSPVTVSWQDETDKEGSEQPAGGRVCHVCGDGEANVLLELCDMYMDMMHMHMHMHLRVLYMDMYMDMYMLLYVRSVSQCHVETSC
jgi:hypothetical protein